MRKIEVCRKYTEDDNSGKICLRYYITVDEIPLPDADCSLENYGVGVLLEPDDEETVRCITPEAEKVERLIDLLATNLVCPTTLNDIVDDILAEGSLI